MWSLEIVRESECGLSKSGLCLTKNVRNGLTMIQARVDVDTFVAMSGQKTSTEFCRTTDKKLDASNSIVDDTICLIYEEIQSVVFELLALSSLQILK